MARGALQADARLLERGAGAGDRGDVAADGGFGVDRIDLQQELTGRDAIAFFHGEPGDAAHRLGADVDGLLRVDLARRRDDGLEIAPLDGFHGDRGARLAPARERRRRAAADHHQHHHDPEPFLAKHGPPDPTPT